MDGWKILILSPGGLQVPLSLPIEEKKISATPRPKPRPDRVIFWAPPIFHEDGEKCTFENAQISILTYVVGTRSLGARLLVTFSLSAIKTVSASK